MQILRDAGALVLPNSCGACAGYGATFEEVKGAIATTTGGAATTSANTAQGQFKRLGVALSETKESIGAALLPAVEAVLPYLTKLGAWASEHPQILLAVGAAIATIAAAIVAVNVAMALNPFSLIAIGVVALGATLVAAYKSLSRLKQSSTQFSVASNGGSRM